MHHTHFSFRKAVGSPDEVCKRLKELGYTYAALSDFDNTFALIEWQKSCEKYDLKPVYGVKIAITESINAKKPSIDYFTFYAKNNLKDLNNVIKKAYEGGRSLPRLGFVPMLRYSDLASVAFNGLIIVAGRKANLEILPQQDNIFVGISAGCSRGFTNYSLGMFANSDNKLFAMADSWYVNEDDQQWYEVQCGMNADVRTYDQHIISHEQWLQNITKIVPEEVAQTALDNMNKAFSECNVIIENGDLIRLSPEKSLREMCVDGAKIKGVDLTDPVYQERLDMELKVIADKGFDDYFFLVADLLQWANQQMLVGPGRGSSAGSLVCYLLDITDVDPIKYNLLFFRFLDPSRPDWPDIDSDFSDRDAAVEYLANKYGAEKVAKIGTTANYIVDNTINEVCKALLLPRFEFQPLIDEIKSWGYSANDKRWSTAIHDALEKTVVGQRLIKKYPEFVVATKITDTPSHAGSHASGVIVSQDAITNTFAINPQSQTAMAVAGAMEGKGFIKLDVLGLINLTVIDNTMKMAGITREDLRNIDLEDENVFKVMNEHRYKNIFQYEGAGVSKLAKQVVVDSFNDFVAISSFARPGPLSSGSAERWADKKNGVFPVSYIHPLFEPYFKDTLGEMAYQEQIMLVAHDIAGLGWDIVSKMRKAIAKSMGAEALKEFGEPFKQGLMKAGVPEDVTDKFWNDILGCGSYLFNKSHAAAYGLISYWTCYLKAYYPLEFACAALTEAKSTDKQIEVLKEMRDEGIDYIPFDIMLSTDEWRVTEKDGKKVLLGPLKNIVGVGPKTLIQIMQNRSLHSDFNDWPESLQKKLKNAKSAFSTLTPITDYRIENNVRKFVIDDFTDIGTIACNGEWQEGIYTFGVCEVIAERDENDPKRQQDRIARNQEAEMSGQTKFVELRVRDDTGIFYHKIGRYDYEQWGKEILEKGREGKTLVVCKSTLCPQAPVLLVKGFKIVGEF